MHLHAVFGLWSLWLFVLVPAPECALVGARIVSVELLRVPPTERIPLSEVQVPPSPPLTGPPEFALWQCRKSVSQCSNQSRSAAANHSNPLRAFIQASECFELLVIVFMMLRKGDRVLFFVLLLLILFVLIGDVWLRLDDQEPFRHHTLGHFGANLLHRLRRQQAVLHDRPPLVRYSLGAHVHVGKLVVEDLQ